MSQRLSFACLFVIFLFFAGCKGNTDLTESPETQGTATVPDSLPLPNAEELDALGPLNDLDTRWLLSDPVYVAAGQPYRFLSSPLGQGNAEIISGQLSMLLQAPLEYHDVARFVFSQSTPLQAVVEVTEQGVRVPRPVLLYRRTTVLTFVEPIRPEDFFKRFFLAPQQIEEIPRRKVGHHEVFDLTPPNLAVPQKLALLFADDKTVVLVEGDEPSIQEAFNDAPARGAATERIRRTDFANSDLVVVASREGVPFNADEIRLMLQQSDVLAPFADSFATGFRAITIRADVKAEEGKPMLAVALDTTTPKAAEEISELLLGLLVSGQMAIVSMDDNDKNRLPVPAEFATSLLNSLSVDAVGTRVDATLLKFAGFDTVAAKGISDMQVQMQEQQKQQHRLEQLEFLARAFVAYHQKNQKFPAPILGEDGTPLLSWRVALLPVIGLEELYNKFNLNEPWDGPTNKALLDEMPPVFTSVDSSVEKPRTVLRYFDSEGTPFANRELTAEDLQSPQTTLLIVNVVPEKAVEWTQPDPLEFDAAKIEETVGNILFGISFVGRPVVMPIIPLSDPRSVFQREYLSAVVKGQPVPQPPAMPAH